MKTENTMCWMEEVEVVVVVAVVMADVDVGVDVGVHRSGGN